MNVQPEALDAADLAGRIAPLRALARRLVRDEASADDLVQEAVTRVLAGRQGRARSAGAYLTGVLRNVAKRDHRGAAARRERERRAARGEAQPAADQALSAAEASRAVVDAVMGLDEPYREVVLLRFFEDLPPRRIAERTGRSLPTVKKQLERGLERLRRELGDEHGGAERWATALAPFAWSGMRASGLAAAAGVLVVGGAAGFGAVLAAGAGGESTGARADGSEPLAERGAFEAPESFALAEPGAVQDRSPVLSPPARLSPTSPERVSVTGRVLDHRGRPASGAQVFIGTAQVVTDAEGRFEVDAEPWGDCAVFSAWHPRKRRFAWMPAPNVEKLSPGEDLPPVELHLPERMKHIDVELVDPAGDPVPGLDVVVLRGTLAGAGPALLETLVDPLQDSISWSTDASGYGRIWPLEDREYELRVIDWERGAAYDLGRVRPQDRTQRLVVDLPSISERVSARVTDLFGVPIEGAAVTLELVRRETPLEHPFVGESPVGPLASELSSTITDKDGTFAIDRVHRAGTRLRVELPESMAPRSRPVILELPRDRGQELRVPVPVRLEVRIGHGDSVRFLDEAGAPVATLSEPGVDPLVAATPELNRAAGGGLTVLLDQRARFAVISRGGVEIARLPLELRRETPQVLSFRGGR